MTSASVATSARLAPISRLGSSRRDLPRRTASHVAAGRAPRRASRTFAALAEAKAAPPLTKQDLVDYLRSGCKPKEQWRFVGRDKHDKSTHDMGGSRTREAFPKR